MPSTPIIPSHCAHCFNRHGDLCGAVPTEYTHLLEEAKLSDRVFRSHAMIVQQGDVLHHYHQVIAGWISLFHHDSSGARRVLEILVAGDTFGHMTSASPSSTFTAECLTDAAICTIPHTRMRRLIEDHPEIGLRISDIADMQQDRWHRHLINAVGGSALDRLLDLLVELSNRAQSRRRSPDTKPLVLPLRQIDIADAISLTSVYVNKILKTLESQNVVEIGRGKLTILDVEALRSFSARHEKRNKDFKASPYSRDASGQISS